MEPGTARRRLEFDDAPYAAAYPDVEREQFSQLAAESLFEKLEHLAEDPDAGPEWNWRLTEKNLRGLRPKAPSGAID